MASSGDPPKPKRGPGRPHRGPGRPHGAYDKERDYRGAVSKARKLIAEGFSERAAAEAIGKELSIPASTLRKHLKRWPKNPVFTIHQALGELSIPTEITTPEEAAEAYRRHMESQRQKEPPPKTPAERQIELLRQIDPVLRGIHRKPKRK